MLTGFLLRYTRVGLNLRAIGSNPSAAFLFGLKPGRHMILAMVVFVLEPIGLMLVGLAFRRMNMKTKGQLSILVGIVSLLVTAISMFIPWYTWLDLGAAVPEIMALFVPSVWTVWMGISLIRSE